MKVDVDKMQDWKGGVVKKMTGGVRSLLKANGGEMIEGRGKVVDAKTVEVSLKSGEKRRVSASKVWSSPPARPRFRCPASSSMASA